MAEGKRIFRFDFSGDVPKLLNPKPTEVPEKSGYEITPEHRAAINKGKQERKEHLTPMEKRFCREYVKTCNGAQSVMRAGYNTANNISASVQAHALLKLPKIQAEIDRIAEDELNAGLADAQEVMQFFADVMRGNVKDQFGLEASLAERTKAAQEIAKRTIDIDQKMKANQNGDGTITVKLDWGQLN